MPQPEKMPTPADRLRRELREGAPEARVNAYGALSRHRQAWGVTSEELLQGLSGIDATTLSRVVSAIDVEVVSQKLRSAASEAFEAAFAESDAEARTFRSSACDALSARDALDNVYVTTRALRDAGTDVAGTLGALEAALEQIDATGKKLARELSGANAERRKRAEGLEPEAMARAYWLTSYADPAYDALLVMLGAEEADAKASAEIQSVLAASKLPAGALRGRDDASRSDVVSSALVRAAHGIEIDAERDFVARLAKGDAAVASALDLARERSEDEAG